MTLKLLLSDVKKARNSTFTGAPPQTPLVEFTVLPESQEWGTLVRGKDEDSEEGNGRIG